VPTSGDVRLTSGSALPAEPCARRRKSKSADFPMPSDFACRAAC